MGCPARVADGGGGCTALRQLCLQILDAHLGFVDSQLFVAQEGNAGGVVAAVLEPMQAFENDWQGAVSADVRDDAGVGGMRSGRSNLGKLIAATHPVHSTIGG